MSQRPTSCGKSSAANFIALIHLLLGIFLVTLTNPVFAANGLNLIGFGIDSNLLAGADVAIDVDTASLNTNPAGLAHISGSALDQHLGLGYALGMRHRDNFGNDAATENKLLPLADFGYARRLQNGLVWGIGFFAQGGSGNVYKSLNTAFGTRDELSALFRIAKLSPGLAYSVSEKFSLGLAIPIVYADLEQKIFPDTSVFSAAAPAQSFFGTEISSAKGFGYGIRLGLQFRANDNLTLGATYGNKIPLDLKNGRMVANMSAAGLGRVTYRDVNVNGLALPQEVGLGAAFKLSEAWLLSFKVAWLDWSDALTTSTLSANNPDNTAAPTSIKNTSSLNWRDQTVFALGVAYRASDATTWFGGFNYGKNPIPNETTSPLLAAFAERHLTFGVRHKFSATWQFAGGIEYDFAKTVTYNNPEQLFGPGAQESGELIAVHLGVSRRW